MRTASSIVMRMSDGVAATAGATNSGDTRSIAGTNHFGSPSIVPVSARIASSTTPQTPDSLWRSYVRRSVLARGFHASALRQRPGDGHQSTRPLASDTSSTIPTIAMIVRPVRSSRSV